MTGPLSCCRKKKVVCSIAGPSAQGKAVCSTQGRQLFAGPSAQRKAVCSIAGPSAQGKAVSTLQGRLLSARPSAQCRAICSGETNFGQIQVWPSLVSKFGQTKFDQMWKNILFWKVIRKCFKLKYKKEKNQNWKTTNQT